MTSEVKSLSRVQLCDPMDYSPGNLPRKSTGVGWHFLLQGIFLTQGSTRGLPHCTQRLYLWAIREALSASCSLETGMPQNWESGTRPLRHNMHLEIALAQGESSWAIKQLTWILKKGWFPNKYIVSLTWLKWTFPWVKHTGLLSQERQILRQILSSLA